MKPVSDTAFYCCGVRMLDAARARPICGDTFAERFMNERGREIFRRFSGERGPNVSNAARARYIDDLLRVRLAANPQLRVVLIGCGFDSRAFRLAGGSWLELDEPELIAYKNERLPPAAAPNPLQRLPIEFARESLAAKLAPLGSAGAVVFVIEGVTMYVSGESLRATLGALRTLVPRHEVIADLMTRSFLEHYGAAIRRIIAGLGAELIPESDPAEPFAAADYCETSAYAIAGLALRYHSLGWLEPLARRLAPEFFSGYTVRVFEPVQPA